MVFNSFAFLVFFVIVFSLYLALDHKRQNIMLFAASYVFYAWWDWRFLFLLAASTVIDYFCGLKIHGSRDVRERRFFLWCSIAANLGILGFFKYYNFFVSSLQSLLIRCGISIEPPMLHIILPLGISFYTFQTMSYTIDVFRGNIAPTRKFVDFALFVSFFPQLVAGPIERASHLLPQVSAPRTLTLEKFAQGCYLIFWGLFQKMFIADNLAKIVDPVFAARAPYQGGMVLIALYAFAFQIYCDFSGYSNIARGLGKCMGFDIMINFDLPYFSSNPRQFWQRWHISLSRWLKDYLYIPLGGNRKGGLMTYRNLGLTMLLGGLWHGASWTFVVWGLYHGVMLVIHRATEPFLKNIRLPAFPLISKPLALFRTVFFFHLVCLGWLFFRSGSISQASAMLHAMIYNFYVPQTDILPVLGDVVFFIWFLIVVELAQFRTRDQLFILKANLFMKALFFAVCCYLIVKKGIPNGQAFIYFIF